jgi:hypothetical protein
MPFDVILPFGLRGEADRGVMWSISPWGKNFKFQKFVQIGVWTAARLRGRPKETYGFRNGCRRAITAELLLIRELTPGETDCASLLSVHWSGGGERKADRFAQFGDVFSVCGNLPRKPSVPRWSRPVCAVLHSDPCENSTNRSFTRYQPGVLTPTSAGCPGAGPSTAVLDRCPCGGGRSS